MASAAGSDAVMVTCLVALPPDRAFQLFTADIDRWWQRRPGDPPGRVRFDAGQLVADEGNDGHQVLAKVDRWDPPDGLELAWFGPHASPGDRVEVRFEAEAEAEPARTRVTVHHYRDGLRPEAVEYSIVGLFWSDLLSRLAGAGG